MRPVQRFGLCRNYRVPHALTTAGLDRSSAARWIFLADRDAASRGLSREVDLARADRGNMRCFETMRCGAALATDAGRYLERMTGDGLTVQIYRGVPVVPGSTHPLLADLCQDTEISERCHGLPREHYSSPSDSWHSDPWLKSASLKPVLSV